MTEENDELKDIFAGMALTGMLANPKYHFNVKAKEHPIAADYYAIAAYDLAEQMLRRKHNPPEVKDLKQPEEDTD